MRRFLSLILAAAMVSFTGCSDKNETTPTESGDFTIEQTDLTQGSFGVKVTPKDNEATYYFGVIAKSDYESAYHKNNDELTAAYKAWFLSVASSYGLDLSDLLKEALLSGMQNYSYTALTPETDYVFFVYGVDLEGNPTTDVSTYAFKTPAVTFDSDATFTITPSEIGSTYFTFTITPSDPSVFYFYDIMPKYTFEEYCDSDEANIGSYVSSYLSALRSENDDYSSLSMPEFVAAVTSRGEISYDTALSEAANSLLPEYDYYVFAIGIGNDGTFTTNASVKVITTAETPRNEWKWNLEEYTDIQYDATIYAAYSETFAVLMERKMYFEGETDEQMVNDLVTAHGGNILDYCFADKAAVQFTGLIPGEAYYVFCIACNSDGTPKTGEKLNVVKREVTMKAATKTGATYSIKTISVSKNEATINVSGNDAADDQTYILNYLSEREYNSITASATESEALKKHADEFIDASLKSWNESHGASSQMDRKEFLSRALESDLGTGTSTTFEGLTAGTKYYVYVIGLKPDGTYTTEPFTTSFTTIAEAKSKVALTVGITASQYTESLGIADWVGKVGYYFSATASPAASVGKVYGKWFDGRDAWEGKTASEVIELLQTETPVTSATWAKGTSSPLSVGDKFYVYVVAYDTDGIATAVTKISHTAKLEGGKDGMNQNVTIDKTETL